MRGGEGFQRNPQIPSGSAIAKIKHNIKDQKYKFFKIFQHLTLKILEMAMSWLLLFYDMIAVTKKSIPEKFCVPLLGVERRLPQYKTNALTTEPKSRISDAVVRD